MVDRLTSAAQGPFEGSRCVAGPGSYLWAPATIRRINEDGTFKIESDVKLTIFQYWYGVTVAEISFHDSDQWTPVFEQLSPNKAGLTKADFKNAFTLLGFGVHDEQFEEFWIRGCMELFGIQEGMAAEFVLDQDSAYRLFLHAGFSAKQIGEKLKADKSQKYFKMYWNQLRMGGREPSEISRPVTLHDTLAALGILGSSADRANAGLLKRFEQSQGVLLPDTLKRFLCQRGVAQAVIHSHPNNPSLILPGNDEWQLRRDMRQQGLEGDYAVVIVIPHQGDHEWAAVFDDNDTDARVYIHWYEEEQDVWRLTAPTIGMFFWDLAQTGLTWYQDTQFQRGKPVEPSDIGLVLRPAKPRWRFWGRAR
jgi:hypothetical protein